MKKVLLYAFAWTKLFELLEQTALDFWRSVSGLVQDVRDTRDCINWPHHADIEQMLFDFAFSDPRMYELIKGAKSSYLRTKLFTDSSHRWYSTRKYESDEYDYIVNPVSYWKSSKRGWVNRHEKARANAPKFNDKPISKTVNKGKLSIGENAWISINVKTTITLPNPEVVEPSKPDGIEAYNLNLDYLAEVLSRK